MIRGRVASSAALSWRDTHDEQTADCSCTNIAAVTAVVWKHARCGGHGRRTKQAPTYPDPDDSGAADGQHDCDDRACRVPEPGNLALLAFKAQSR